MTNATTDLSRLLDVIVDHLDVPRSYYEKAADRHRSLGAWLHRPESRLAAFDPDLSLQGSFRFGTVNRPLHEGDDYDLDNVCALRIAKNAITQKELKRLYGLEIKDYAVAHDMRAAVEEHNRCWRLPYADEVCFHMDTLPCVPEEPGVIRLIVGRGAAQNLADLAIAITDRRHARYAQLTRDWFSSNPRGFAVWFEARARLAAGRRMRELVEGRVYASVEEVPPYEWKTPLQRSIQMLKRHRDVMFLEDATFAPISMIITNLAAQAYAGETDVAAALLNILERMPQYVKASRPRVPNPADPAEDYADKWVTDGRYEENFILWHMEAKVDFAKLASYVGGGRLASQVRHLFGIELTPDERELFERASPPPATPAGRPAPTLYVPAAVRPWQDDV